MNRKDPDKITSEENQKAKREDTPKPQPERPEHKPGLDRDSDRQKPLSGQRARWEKDET